MLLDFDIIQNIAMGTNPVAIHNIDNTVTVTYVSEDGQMKGITADTPLGEWDDRVFDAESRISGEINIQSLHIKTIPRYKNAFVWYADGVHRIAINPDSSPLNTSDDPYRLFYGIDSEKLYMNIAQHWELVATTDHTKMKGLEDDSHTQYLNANRHALEPHQELKDGIDTLQEDVDTLQTDIDVLKETPPGTIDLTGYYLKSEIDQLLASFVPPVVAVEAQYVNWAIIGASVYNMTTKSLVASAVLADYSRGGYGTVEVKKEMTFIIKSVIAAAAVVWIGLTYDYTKSNIAIDTDGRVYDFSMKYRSDGRIYYYEAAVEKGSVAITDYTLEGKIKILSDKTVEFYHGSVLVYTSTTKASGAPLYPKCRMWNTSEVTYAKAL